MMDEMLEASSTAHMFWERGRIEGLRDVARLGLEHRFGALGADLLQAIGAADEPTLTTIITYSEESLEQVRARLGLPGEAQ